MLSYNNGVDIIDTSALHLYKTIISIHLKLGSYIRLHITAGNDTISTCQMHMVVCTY